MPPRVRDRSSALAAVPAAITPSSYRTDETRGCSPIPDYEGDIWSRSYLTGDWWGTRTDLAEKGIQFDVDSVTWIETVVDGGVTGDSEFGGNVTYNLKWDLMRSGILPGALIQVRGESRFGSSANPNSGEITPELRKPSRVLAPDADTLTRLADSLVNVPELFDPIEAALRQVASAA